MRQCSALRAVKSFPGVFAVLFVTVFAVPQVFAQCSKSSPANCAYVTDGAGGDIFAVDRTTLAATKLTSINNATLNDIRVASDNFIYVTTQNSVLRVSESGSGKAVHVFDATNPVPGPFGGIRFSPVGDAYVNTPNGVYRLLINGATSFPVSATQVTAKVCGKSAGLAVWPTGDLLIACDNQVLRCPAGLDGVVADCTGANPPQVQVSDAGGTITGLAVDAAAGIIVAAGNTVTRYCNPVTTACAAASTTLATFTDVPAYLDTAPFPQGFPASQAGGTPPCNSGEVTVFVSTGDASSKNGKVWAINTASTVSTVPPKCDLLATPSISAPTLISSTRPAVGLGVAQTSRTLAKTLNSSNSFSELYVQGPFTIQITNNSVTNASCGLVLTAQREATAPLDAILAQATDSVTGKKVSARAIPFNGEESWRTSFHGGLPASGCSATSDTHIGITGSLNSVNPWIVLIDDATRKASLDPIPSVYPQFPLVGVPGDPIKIQNASPLFTTNARIVLADRGFTANGGLGYQFNGFLPPLVETPDPSFAGSNVINSGKSFVLKFSLSTSNGPITNAQGAAAVTGISVARLSCSDLANEPGCVGFQQMLVDPTGQSATPPSFNFSSGQFHFNLDTNQADGTQWCNGVYEATANSDTFSPHTIYFTIVGGPVAPKACF